MCVGVLSRGGMGGREQRKREAQFPHRVEPLEPLKCPIHFHVEILLKAFYYDYQ